MFSTVQYLVLYNSEGKYPDCIKTAELLERNDYAGVNLNQKASSALIW